MGGWGKQLAELWTYDVPPSRPSVAEMAYYAHWADIYRKRVKRRLRILVLGSTPEFRDWAYEENAEITIVDKSREYYQTISREMRHKGHKENLVISEWETMTFCNQFDLVVGDLALGNIDRLRIDETIKRIASSLVPSGLLMGKSFIWDESYLQEDLETIAEDYYTNGIGIHPYTFINHRLGFYCLDKKSRTIKFSYMYRCLSELRDKGAIDDEVMGVFDELGWTTDMIASFYAPSKDDLLRITNPYFTLTEFGQVKQVYSDMFPTFVFTRK